MKTFDALRLASVLAAAAAALGACDNGRCDRNDPRYANRPQDCHSGHGGGAYVRGGGGQGTSADVARGGFGGTAGDGGGHGGGGGSGE